MTTDIDPAAVKPAAMPLPGLSGTPNRSILLMIALAGALPTLLGLVGGNGLVLDDLEFAAAARFEGWNGFADELRYRPIQGLVHGVEFGLFGTNAVPHHLLLALLNGLVAVQLARLALRWLPHPVAVASIAFWLVIPHRGGVRYWASTNPNHIAMLLLAAAALRIGTQDGANAGAQGPLLSDPDRSSRGQLSSIALLVAASISTYEGGVVLGGVVLVAAAWQASTSLRDAIINAVAVSLPSAAAFIWIVVQSPRRGASTPFGGSGSAVPTHIASLAPGRLSPLVVVALAAMATIFLLTVLRSFHTPKYAPQLAFGFVLFACGLIPFVAGGFNLGPSGVLDRGHYFADIGTALMLGAVAATGIATTRLQLRNLSRPVIAALAMIVLGLLAGATHADSNDYANAAEDGDRLGRAVLSLAGSEPDAEQDCSTITLAKLPSHNGVAVARYDQQIDDIVDLTIGSADSCPRLNLVWQELSTIDGGLYPVAVLDGNVLKLADP